MVRSALIVVLGVLLTATPAAHAVPVPSEDPFYRPPSPLPVVAPGTILRARPVHVPLPVTAYQVLYRSTDAKGRPNAVSGTVMWGGAPGPRPLVSYAVGSHGLGPKCAPSYQLRQGRDFELPLMSMALSRGWAVVVTDYEGSGTPGPHTYAAGHATGHAVLDAARAALRLPQAGLGPAAPVGIWGYSEGGLGSTWAGELQPTYAPELNLKGVAAGGIPYDIGNVAAKVDGTELSGFILAAAVGLNRAYPELDLPSILNERGRAAAARIASQCVYEWTPELAFTRTDSLTVEPDAIKLPRFQQVISTNRLGQRTPGVPLYVYESVADEFMPINDVRTLVRTYCGAGVPVRYHEDYLSEHVTLAASAAPSAVAWLGNRFAGAPAPSTC